MTSFNDEQPELTYLRQRVAELEHALTEAQSSQQALEQAAVGIVWHDLNGNIAYVNNAFCRNVGYNRAELLHGNILAIDADFNADESEDLWQAALEHGSVVFETSHRRKDGSTYVAEVVISPLQIADCRYICGIARDITERKQQVAELHLIKRMIDNSPDAMAMADHQGRIIYANNTLRSMFGYGDTIIGIDLKRIFSELDDTMIAAFVEEIRRTGSVQGVMQFRRAMIACLWATGLLWHFDANG
ncbi:MAG: PAS domain S-box protein, partial [Chloroflexaceae bacterium]|nr:PAS domain S-box protein [Chloroflexaceae bacterium]